MRNQWLEDRLTELRPRGKTKKGLAGTLGISPSGITDLLHGKRKIKGKEISLVARYLEWPTDKIMALLSGGEPTRDAQIFTVYVRGVVQAGLWREALEWPKPEWRPIGASPVRGYNSHLLFGLDVVGPSMNQLYPDGSVVLCVSLFELGRGPVSGERVVVLRRDPRGDKFEATIKELRQDREGTYWLWPRSDDPNFQTPWKLERPDEHDDNEDIRIVAVVVGSQRPEPPV